MSKSREAVTRYFALGAGSYAYAGQLAHGRDRPSFTRRTVRRLLGDLVVEQERLRVVGQFEADSVLSWAWKGASFELENLPNKPGRTILTQGTDGKFDLSVIGDWVPVPPLLGRQDLPAQGILKLLRSRADNQMPTLYTLGHRATTEALVEAFGIGSPNDREVITRLLGDRSGTLASRTVAEALTDRSVGVRNEAAHAAWHHPEFIPRDVLWSAAEAESDQTVQEMLIYPILAHGAGSARLRELMTIWGWSPGRQEAALIELGLTRSEDTDAGLADSLSWFVGNELGLYQVAARFGDIDSEPSQQIRDDTVNFIRPLLEGGWLEVGQLLSRDPRPWVPLEMSAEEAVEMVQEIWDVEQRQPTLLDDIWFRLTDRGLAVFERSSEESPSP